MDYMNAWGDYIGDDLTPLSPPAWYNHLCDCKWCEQYRIELLDFTMQQQPIIKDIPFWDETYNFIEKL